MKRLWVKLLLAYSVFRYSKVTVRTEPGKARYSEYLKKTVGPYKTEIIEIRFDENLFLHSESFNKHREGVVRKALKYFYQNQLPGGKIKTFNHEKIKLS